MSTAAARPPVLDGSATVGRRSGRFRHPLAVGLAAALLGVLGTAIGGGIGFRHLMKTGVTATAVLGLTVFLVGLGLLVLAVVLAWRATSGWQRLWLVPGTLVALLVMSSVAQGTMLAYAPRSALGTVNPAAYGLSVSEVTFPSADGVRLAAWFVPSTNRAAVVLVPGSGSNRHATLGQAQVLARAGYGLLLLDPRGQGRSGGHAMDAGWYGERDIPAAVRFVGRQPGVDPQRVAVLGLSMGGEEAIGAVAADPAIRAVVAEGATHRTAADKAGYLPGGVNGAVQRGLDQLTYGVAALLSDAPRPGTLHRAIASARGTSFLLIAAGHGVDERQAVTYLRSAAPSRVQTWIVPGATHVHGLAAAPQEWSARVTSFLAEHLLR